MVGEEQVVRIGSHRLRVSNLTKVLYPETGTTKAELISYVTRMAPVMIPHLRGRPVTRKRWPEGVGTGTHPESSFFGKDLERGAPEWVARRAIEHSSGAKHYPLADNVETLAYLTQVASLELHVPQWRFDSDGARQHPDRLVLDLDPGPGVGLAECAQVALWTRELLDGMGLVSVPVTSGSKGIHVYAALPQTRSSDEVSAVARALAQALEADHPDLVVSAMAKSVRAGRVFIDWSQNNGNKTTISPYSLRGQLTPTVAAPRSWDEIAHPGLRQLRFDEAPERVSAHGDLLGALLPRQGSALSAYLDKRNAARTPEPVPRYPAATVASAGAPVFVIHRHQASRLHFDLRLERDGVLVSWAVPRGIPETPARNHLAVMTENHPLSYLTFAGTIPVGEYGAGAMTVWDSGRYSVEKWRDDEVIFTATGSDSGPLGTAQLALIRTEGAGEKSQWLLHRMSPGSASITAPTPKRQAVTPAPAEKAGPVQAMLATASTVAHAHTAARRWGAWAEIKWDGMRALGFWDGHRLTLRARTGNNITASYPELTAAPLGLGRTPAVLDGEIVALDQAGHPRFSLLQRRMHLTNPREITRELSLTPVRYHLFDLLSLGDDDLTSSPLHRRRDQLADLAAQAVAPIAVPAVFEDLDAALDLSRRFGLEGIMVKNPASSYYAGRSEDWLKIKLTRTAEVIIGGIRPGKREIASLLLGIPDQTGLRYVGRVGTGFTDATLRQLSALLDPLRCEAPAFHDVPASDTADAIWVRPELVAEVIFAELSPSGRLRHARWRGLRPDKKPEDVGPVS